MRGEGYVVVLGEGVSKEGLVVGALTWLLAPSWVYIVGGRGLSGVWVVTRQWGCSTLLRKQEPRILGGLWLS